MEYGLLVLAFYLSVLTYYIGILLYMLPLPFYSIKKWAPTLMVDGVFSASLVFLYTLILYVMKYLGNVIGSDWNSFYTWITVKTGLVVSLIAILKLIGIALSMAGLGFLSNSLLSPLITLLTYVVIILLLITVVSAIIIEYGARLIAIGILLHAVPFRLTRASGAMIISMVIVFSIGLPLMPLFVENISHPISLQTSNLLDEYGVSYLIVHVYDKLGNGVPYPIVYVYVDDTLVARYNGDSRGTLNLLDPNKGLPSNKTYTLEVEVCGYRTRYLINPREDYVFYNNGSTILNIYLKNLVSLGVCRFIVVDNSDLLEVNVYRKSSNGNTTVFTDLEYIFYNNSYLSIVYQDSDYTSIYVNGSSIVHNESTRYKWRNIDLVKQTFYSHNISVVARFLVSITYKDSEVTGLDSLGRELYYMKDSINMSITEPTKLINPVVYIIFDLLIAPLAYIAVLTSSSYALARILGGAYPGIFYALTLGRRLR